TCPAAAGADRPGSFGTGMIPIDSRAQTPVNSRPQISGYFGGVPVQLKSTLVLVPVVLLSFTLPSPLVATESPQTTPSVQAKTVDEAVAASDAMTTDTPSPAASRKGKSNPHKGKDSAKKAAAHSKDSKKDAKKNARGTKSPRNPQKSEKPKKTQG